MLPIKFRFNILLLFFSLSICAQADFNLEPLSFTSFNERGNDCWGFVDDSGLEYAIVGSRTATHIYSLEDPSAPIERAVINGSESTWRDIKSFGNFIYVIADSGNDGLLIIDMTNAPDQIEHSFWRPELTMAGVTDTLNVCHNLYIDENGICYLAGCRIPERENQGVILLDITSDPNTPSVLGFQTNAYAHDVFAQDNIMYTSDIFNGEFSIYDVSDKSNPIFLAGAETSSIFTHNAWVSSDGNTLFTTDEVANAFVDAYDISDLDEIRRIDTHRPPETVDQGASPHNTHYINDYLVTSWYSDGVVITDVSRPDNMVKVGGFDTYISDDGRFAGCWGAFPYLPSGLIIASNITNSPSDGNGGFYILQPNYQRAAHLEGQITDGETGSSINQVEVQILNTPNLATNSDPGGNYKTGIPIGGSLEVRFSHPEYFTKIETVELTPGDLTILDTSLDPKPSFIVSGNVSDLTSGIQIPFAEIYLNDGVNQFSTIADQAGDYSVEVLVGDYLAVAGNWGHLYGTENLTVSDNIQLNFSLSPGYQDDFLFDYGWQVNGDAEEGIWERGLPIGTFTFNNFPANPGFDSPTDLGDFAFITGIQGTEVQDDDVDNGLTVLSSPPMDLTKINEPHLHFDYWFFDQGSGTPDDLIEILISNGQDTVLILSSEHIGEVWTSIENIFISDFITPSQTSSIIVRTSDFMGSDHVVEAGFDKFLITEGAITSTSDFSQLQVKISPNPFDHYIEIEWVQSQNANAFIYDQMGQLIDQFEVENGSSRYEPTTTLKQGVYIISIVDEAGMFTTQKLIKI